MNEIEMKIDFEDFKKKNNLPKKGEKIVVAMSGGVDSSIAAVLLVKAGYEVVGVTMQLHESKIKKKNKTCCSGLDIADAKDVANKFGFKHYIIDYQKEFEKTVINDFVNSYARGETPIPCIRCNQTVKFTDLINFTKKVNSKYLVTGHYVRRVSNDSGSHIYQAIDDSKDQSYFLFATTNSQLEMLRFPLGEFKKTQVREIANFFNLSNAKKPDSQDICFIPNGDYRSFVKKRYNKKSSSGIIETFDGKFLGYHKGIINFTIGQRKGIGVGGIKGESYQQPYYVVKIDKDNNKIIVGPKSELKQYRIYLKDINLINYDENKNFRAEIKIRSGKKKVSAFVKVLSDKTTGVVELNSPEQGVAPGQACVFYQKEKVIGGGWITASEQENLRN